MRRREKHEEASKGTGKNRFQIIQDALPGEPGERGPDGRRTLREHGIDCLQRDRLRLLPESCEVRAVCTVKTDGKTGVEMEALTGVSTALLTIYDMCKAIDKRMVIKEIHLVSKDGGKSGAFRF